MFWHWHGSKVFSIYEVHRVSVDDTGVIILRLNFEIVRDQIDRALGDECRVRPVGLVSKTTTSTTASTAATTEDALEFLSLGGCSEYLIFLKGLQIVHVKVTDN